MILAGTLCHDGRLGDGWIEVEGGVIAGAGWGRAPRRVDEAVDGVIARGLVDLQVNGCGGDEVTGGADALARIAERELDRGVTSFLATVITTDDETATAAVRAIAEQAAEPASPVMGAHLEGPFLSAERRGVHRAEFLREPVGGVPAYYDDPAVRLVTLAPETAGALELCEALSRRGVVVSLGHTAASADVAQAAAARGARMVTHLFNAMPPLHHRDPGVAGWALTSSSISLGLIADGHHVDPLMLALVHRAAGDRVVLVSDASVAAGAPPGEYEQAGVSVRLTPDGGAVDRDGRLAGTSITLDEALRRWMTSTGAPLPEALRAATSRPARLVGLPGELTPGDPADLVVLDAEHRVARVMQRGRWVRPR